MNLSVLPSPCTHDAPEYPKSTRIDFSDDSSPVPVDDASDTAPVAKNDDDDKPDSKDDDDLAAFNAILAAILNPPTATPTEPQAPAASSDGTAAVTGVAGDDVPRDGAGSPILLGKTLAGATPTVAVDATAAAAAQVTETPATELPTTATTEAAVPIETTPASLPAGDVAPVADTAADVSASTSEPAPLPVTQLVTTQQPAQPTTDTTQPVEAVPTTTSSADASPSSKTDAVLTESKPTDAPSADKSDTEARVTVPKTEVAPKDDARGSELKGAQENSSAQKSTGTNSLAPATRAAANTTSEPPKATSPQTNQQVQETVESPQVESATSEADVAPTVAPTEASTTPSLPKRVAVAVEQSADIAPAVNVAALTPVAASSQTVDRDALKAGAEIAVAPVAAKAKTATQDVTAETTTFAGSTISASAALSANATAGASNSAAVSTPAHVSQQVMQALATYQADVPSGSTKSFTMMLDPPELGRLMIQMSRGSKGMDVRISAENDSVKSILETHGAELQQSLQLGGFDLSQFNSSTGSSENSFGEVVFGAGPAPGLASSGASAPLAAKVQRSSSLNVKV